MLALLLPAAPAAAADWTGRLVALAPALRACLAGAGPAAYATAVEAEAEEGVLRVLLHRPGAAGAAECRVASGAGGAVSGWRDLPGAVPPDPAAPAFFLERRCVDARRIDAPDGTVLGWLAYPAC